MVAILRERRLSVQNRYAERVKDGVVVSAKEKAGAKVKAKEKAR